MALLSKTDRITIERVKSRSESVQRTRPLKLGAQTRDRLNCSYAAVQNKLLDMMQSEIAHQELSTLINIQREKAQAWSGTYGDATMPSLHKSQRHALASVTCALACIAINAAHAEVASVYGGSDGRCGSRTANGERVNCSAMTAAHRTLSLGSRVTVCHHGCVVVRNNDRGPFVLGRQIDLTPAAARAIGLDQIGEASLSR